MRRVPWLLLLTCLLLPQVAHAIQLHWAGGATDITVSSNTQAVLVVQADSAEATLPNTWRLQWTADSLQVQFSAFDPNSACLVDTAKVDSIIPPSTPADSAANQVTALFCSSGSQNAATAYFLADLPADGHGKLKVVALNPADTTQVVESNEVTFNGGIGGDYAPTILAAVSTHHLGELTLTVTGTGLNSADAIGIAAPDTAWRFPLSIVSRTDASLTAQGTLAAPLPQCVVEAKIGTASVATASLAADSFPTPNSAENYCFFFYPGSRDTIYMQPKDFTYVFTGDMWHVFYIRHYQDAPGSTTYHDNPDWNERNLGHVTSTDLQTWTVAARNVLQVPGTWDTKHVWAPHIVKKPNDITYYLFYTGVDANDNQKMGVATSTDLINWTRPTTPILSASDISWADPNPPYPYNGQQQFRDPFVMQDPNNSGQWLMYYTTVAQAITPGMVVGVAKSPTGNFNTWQDLRPLWKTSSRLIGSSRIESPHAFKRNGNWWVMYTPTYSAADTIRFEVNADPVNGDTTTWGPHVGSMNPSERLFSVAQGYETPWTFLNGWHATEYTEFKGAPYLAAYDDYNQSIDFIEIGPAAPPDSFNVYCPTLDVPQQHSSVPQAMALSVKGPLPSHGGTTLQLALPAEVHVDIAIYDVQGRRVRALLNGPLPAGIINVPWDGRDAAGQLVRSGVYFARVLCPHAQRVARIPLIR
jgi:hypothetical protein